MAEDDFEKQMEETARELSIPKQGIDIGGLEEVPASIIPVPYLRLVQPTSQKVSMVDGKDAPSGVFYFNDTQRTDTKVSVAILKAKHGVVVYERDGEQIPTRKLAVLIYDLLVKKLYILPLSVMSFGNFGRLIAQLKEKEIKNIWEYEIMITTEKQENEKGKYYVAKFEIGNKIVKEDLEELEKLSRTYGDVLERQEPEGKV